MFDNSSVTYTNYSFPSKIDRLYFDVVVSSIDILHMLALLKCLLAHAVFVLMKTF